MEAALSQDIEYASTTIILEGALIGAAVGCGIGLILGGSARNCAVGAAVGAVGGGVAGAAVADGNAKQILAEDKEDRLYAELSMEGEELQAYNQRVELAVARLAADYNALEARRRGKTVDAATYEAELASIKRDTSRLLEHARDQRATVEERNVKFEEYQLSERVEDQRDLNLAVVFESADLVEDFDRKLES